jgi:hypothetical protein
VSQRTHPKLPAQWLANFISHGSGFEAVGLTGVNQNKIMLTIVFSYCSLSMAVVAQTFLPIWASVLFAGR